MKKILIILMLLILSGCNNTKTGNEPVNNIKSSGKLTCIYKSQNYNEKTTYTSYYIYNFDKNGILRGLTNHEEISFDKSKEDIKKKYKESIEEVIKEYKGIDGIMVETMYEDNKYYFEVKVDKSKLSEDLYKDYYLDEDRITLYNLFESKQYTCE